MKNLEVRLRIKIEHLLRSIVSTNQVLSETVKIDPIPKVVGDLVIKYGVMKEAQGLLKLYNSLYDRKEFKENQRKIETYILTTEKYMKLLTKKTTPENILIRKL